MDAGSLIQAWGSGPGRTLSLVRRACLGRRSRRPVVGRGFSHDAFLISGSLSCCKPAKEPEPAGFSSCFGGQPSESRRHGPERLLLGMRTSCQTAGGSGVRGARGVRETENPTRPRWLTFLCVQKGERKFLFLQRFSLGGIFVPVNK